MTLFAESQTGQFGSNKASSITVKCFEMFLEQTPSFFLAFVFLIFDTNLRVLCKSVTVKDVTKLAQATAYIVKQVSCHKTLVSLNVFASSPKLRTNELVIK
jgi:hypothetical protein